MGAVTVAPTISFGALLKRYRRTAGLSQQELAERAGYSVGHLSKLETSTRMPTPATAELLADVLELSAHERSIILRAARSSAPAPQVQAGSSAEFRPPLVDREQEVAHLERFLGESDVPMLVFAGGPGVGKSRLLGEAVERGRRGGWSVVQGQSYRSGADEPYMPLLGALAAYIRGMEPSRLRNALQGSSWLVRLLPELEEAGASHTPTWALPPQQERRLIFAAVRRFLANIGGPSGTLLVLDNLQWASADALDLLAACMRSGDEMPLQVVGAYRNGIVDEQPALAALMDELTRERLTAVEVIEPLAPAAARALLQGLLAGSGSDATAYTDEVLHLAGGNPYVLVSFARTLRTSIERGIPPSLAIPQDVTQAIRQLMAQLPNVAQQVLQIAVVAGGPIPRPVLVTVASKLGHNEPAVAKSLDDLCKAAVLEEQTGAAYVCSNNLVAEVVDRDLGTAQRTYLHGEVAAALEQQPGPSAEALADHYVRAGETAKALPHLERAGRRAEALHANAQAEHYYRELVASREALGKAHEAAQAREHLGTVLGLMGRHDDALAELERALLEYRADGEHEGQARAATLMGWIYGSRGLAEEGLGRLDDLGVDAGLFSARGNAILYLSLARLYFLGGRYGDELQVAERAADVARAFRDERLLAMAELERGTALEMMGHGEESLQVLEEMVVPLAATLDDPWMEVEALERAARDHLIRGEFAQARRIIERWQVIGTSLEDRVLLAGSTLHSGVLRFYVGQWKEAQVELLRAQATLRRFADASHAASASGWLGRLLLARGRVGDASRLLRETIAIAEQCPDPRPAWLAHCALAEYALVSGSVDDAFAHLDPLLATGRYPDFVAAEVLPLLAWGYLQRRDAERAAGLLADSIGHVRAFKAEGALASAQCVQARVAAQRGDWEKANAALQDAVLLAQRLPYPYVEAKALYVGGQIDAAKGETAHARERYHQALDICDRLGEGLYRPHIQHALASL